MKKWLAFVCLPVAGLVAAAAVAAGTPSTGEVSVCATASTPAHTVGVDGSGVATIAGDTASQCATTTYTIPTVTDTVTVTDPGTTTTAPTTTTTSSSPTFASETAYASSPPAFTAKREIDVADATALKSAIANLQPGDLVKATAAFTVGGETQIAKRLSAPAELILSGVKFSYTGGSNYPAVWLNNSSNLLMYGGEATTNSTGGGCILDYGSQNVTWWGFKAHDCGGSGFSALTVNGAVSHDDFEGEIWNVGKNLSWDPHADKGTGLHCAGEMADADHGYAFTANRLAFYCHDIAVGEAFAFGVSPTAADLGKTGGTNTLILKADRLTCVATTQSCGSAITLWGLVSSMALDIKYLEVNNVTGYALFDNAASSGATLDGVTVEYGRASNAMTNTYPKGLPLWGTPKGQRLVDVQP